MKRTKEDALKTKQKLIDSALEVFLEKGFSAATLQDVAEHAGVTRGAFYWHFKTKEDLYRELYEREHSEFMDFLGGLFDNDMPPFEKLRHFAVSIINHLYESERYSKYVELTFFKIEYAGFHDVNKVKTRTNNLFVAAVEKLLNLAREDGSIPKKISPEIVAKTLNVILMGIHRQRFSVPEFFAKKEHGLEVVNGYLDLIEKS